MSEDSAAGPRQDTVRIELALEQIVLFGSQVRSDATDASDIDLLIIVEESFRNGRERMEMMIRLWRVLSEVRSPKDLLEYSCD